MGGWYFDFWDKNVWFLFFVAVILIESVATFLLSYSRTRAILGPVAFVRYFRERPARFHSLGPVNTLVFKSIWILYAPYIIGFGLTLPFMLAAYSRDSEAKAFEKINDLPKAVIAKLLEDIGGYTRFRRFKSALLMSAQGTIEREFSLANYKQLFPDQPLANYFANYNAKYQVSDLRELVHSIWFDAFTRLFKGLPAYVDEPVIFEAPIYDAITSPKPIDDFFHAFQRPDRLFWSVFSNYTRDWYAAKTAVEAKFIEMNSTKYFAKIAESFYAFSGTSANLVPITIPPQLRFEGVWIIAPPGRGKTTLLSAMLTADLEQVKSGAASIILMDSKGDLIDHVRRLKEFGPDGALYDRLVLIEPSGNLALNPLDLGKDSGHTIALLEYVFTGLLDTQPTPLQSTLFRSVLLAMNAIPNATFDTFRKFLTEGWRPFEEYIRLMHADDQAFFLDGEYDSKTYAETKQQLLWRIRDLTTKVPLLRDMFKAPRTQLDLAKEMDAGKVIIIDNSAAKLSAGSEFFARFFVALILAAAQQRAGRKDADKLPCYFYIDECDTVIARDNNIANILHRCRSQKIGLVLAHQELQQIRSDDVKGALMNCAVRIANSDDEASQLAPRLRTTIDVLRSLRRGQFAVFMRDLTPRPIIVNVPNNPVSGWPKMEEHEFAAIQAKMEKLYCFTPTIGEQVANLEARISGLQAAQDDTAPGKWG